MKKTAIFLLLSAGLNTAFAADDLDKCADMDSYDVSKTSFTQVNLSAALSKLLKDTPYTPVIAGIDDLQVSASNVTGPLGGVIKSFSKEAGFTFKNTGCRLEVTITPKALPQPTQWTLNEGALIGKSLQAWGKKVGWTVYWNLSKDITVPANTVFTGDFKTAATEVINTLADNGALIRAHFADGNKTLIVAGPGVPEK